MTGKHRNGFSLFEMLIVVAIVGMIALATVPVAEITYIKTQETQLEKNMADIRQAIALWKRDCRNVVVARYGYNKLFEVPDSQLYPPTLEALTKSMSHPILATDGSILQDSVPSDIYFYSQPYLQRIPQDPFVGAASWTIHCASGTTGFYENGNTWMPASASGVFDISCVDNTGNQRRGFVTAIDGTKYTDW
ncbi:MAG: prepilin-type N-terminal cleavage/methylation domain-containing protein [Candidatus Riflebacteria bacterium]|nr:prepilin-type N-terminal cleavage/methylation domain-containing protein [Candidatus Riflebacteria bacterium]